MKTPGERSNISPLPTGSATPLEPFAEPGATDLASLTDGREPASFTSVYSSGAWFQIGIELLYLVSVLVAALVSLVVLARFALINEAPDIVRSVFGSYPAGRPMVTWAAAALGGLCGGCSSSLKWLYHAVAKKRWHRDRVVWRFVVPILSAVLAVFSGLMIVSGIIPFLSKTPFASPAAGAAFGFFIGFFSDNVLAGLQRFALSTFGTVDKSGADNKSGKPVANAEE